MFTIRRCYSLSCVQLFVTPGIVAHQIPLSMDFPGKNTGMGCHFSLHLRGVHGANWNKAADAGQLKEEQSLLWPFQGQFQLFEINLYRVPDRVPGTWLNNSMDGLGRYMKTFKEREKEEL